MTLLQEMVRRLSSRANLGGWTTYRKSLRGNSKFAAFHWARNWRSWPYILRAKYKAVPSYLHQHRNVDIRNFTLLACSQFDVISKARSENDHRRLPQSTAERTADHRRTNRRPPQDSTGRTAEHCRTRKIILFLFRRGSMLK